MNIDSQKSVVIITTVLICSTNLFLIARQVAKRLFYNSPKLMTVIALAAGDILFALFPMAIEASIIFNPETTSIRCGVYILYVTYQNYLLHFVYGAGLIMLMTESVYKERLLPEINVKLRAVIVSSTPWLIGLIVVLSLCLTKVDYTVRCVSNRPVEALYAATVFLPVCLAVLVAIVVNFAKLPTTPQQRQGPLFSQQPVVTHNQQNVSTVGDTYALSPIPTQNPKQQSALDLTNQPNTIQHSTNQNSTSQYSMIQQGAPHMDAFLNATQAPTQNSRAELRRLALITALFFIMVTPLPSLVIAMKNMTYDNSSAINVIYQIFYWLMVSRSFITPAIMMSYADL
ncbi:hypothetical protein Btru_064683 [Bulinus truncatus]|nr:hypothetical protein Btru_064683 [Bulinus truncatus]